jgi:hypothetical protein
MVILEHTIPTTIICIGIGAVLLVIAFSVWRYLKLNFFILIIMAIRLLFIALMTWCLLQPSLKQSVVNLLKPRFLVVIDSSKSMLLAPPVPNATNRWTEAKKALDQPWKSIVSAECDVDAYYFAAELGSRIGMEAVDSVEVNGPSTLLRDSLRKVGDRYKGQNVTGILLLSDGIDTRETTDDWTQEKWPFPVYTVRLEQKAAWEVEADIRIDTVNTPRRVTVGWNTELKAVVSGQGTKGQAVNVQLFKGGSLLSEAPTQIPEGGGAKEVSFQLQNPEIGVYNYRVFVPPLPGETHTNDNEYVVNVQVIDTKNRLEYVEGPPRWESKYLTHVLKANKQVTPLCFVRGAKGKFYVTHGVQGSMTPDMTESQLAFFKIVIIGNLTGEELGEQRALNLIKFVDDGGSLILLGGSKAWGSGGWATTPLKKILPVKSHGTIIEGKFPVELTTEGKSHAAFSGDPQLWQEVPPVLSIFPEATLSAGAEALVAARTDSGSTPIIVAQRYGQGKVVAIYTDSLWRWQLDPRATEAQYYQRFWVQLLVWLSPSEKEGPTQKLDVFADKEQLFMGEQLEISSRFTDSKGESIQNIAISCEVTTPDKRTVPFSMNKQQVIASGKSFPGFAIKFTAEQAGLYQAVAVAEVEGKKMTSDPISFFVKAFTPESVPRPANVEALTALSQNSGGKFFENVNDLNEALSSLNFSRREEETVKYSSLWQNFIIITCLIALLTIEWSVRKWRNMP